MSASTAPTTACVPHPATDGNPMRRRLQLWRSPSGQPRWARPVLLGIAALAALLYARNITSSYTTYYSVAARSMTESWKAFLFTAFDPSATITLDKIGGFLWPQAISARIFGYHEWALTLPHCIAGVITVLVTYRAVRRWQGPVAGNLAAGLLALTPVAASMFGHAVLDGMVTMCLALAADQYQRAVRDARLRSLLLAGMWIGLGFQAKMMQAWIVVPAMAIGYLVVAPGAVRSRIGHVLAAGAMLFAVSLSWVATMTLTPQNSRPYVDGSTRNSAIDMVFGYNGFDRFGADSGISRPATGGAAGAGTDGPRSGQAQVPGSKVQASGDQGQEQASGGQDQASGGQGGGDGQDGRRNPSYDSVGAGGMRGEQGGRLKLLSARFAPQIGWLYPLTLISLAFGLVRHRGPRTDRGRGGYLLWGVWLLTAAAVLSAIRVPHAAYMSILAAPLAALSAAGTVAMWRAHRSGRRLAAWALPTAVAAQTSWACYLASDHTEFAPWLIPLLIVTGPAGVGALASVLPAARRTRPGRAPAESVNAGGPGGGSAGTALHAVREAVLRRAGTAGLIAGCVAMFAAPTTWSLSVLNEKYAGSSLEASAGPHSRERPRGGPPGFMPSELTADQRKLLSYVEKRDGGTRFPFSTDSWTAASPYIRVTGTPVLPLGGFSGRAASYTLAEYKKLVAAGDLRFAVVGGGAPRPGRRGGGVHTGGVTETQKITSWVRSACTEVESDEYGGARQRPSSGGLAPGPGAPGAPAVTDTGTLYHCAPSDVRTQP